MTRTIIGIAGKARSGKDTVATRLFAEHGFTRIAFADPLKLAAQQMFGLSDAQTWDDKFKEVEIPYWGMSPRRMFQLLGNDACKPVFGDDLWLMRWKVSAGLLPNDDIVVPDVRFDHEAAMLRELGGTILHLDRPGAGLTGTAGAHSSEAGVAFHYTDIRITNNASLATLYSAVDTLVVTARLRNGD